MSDTDEALARLNVNVARVATALEKLVAMADLIVHRPLVVPSDPGDYTPPYRVPLPWVEPAPAWRPPERWRPPTTITC